MAETQHRADVEIFGKTYTLVSDQTPEYAREIAKDVNQRMVEIAADGNLTDTTKIAMMAAMQIADELMKARREGGAHLAAAHSAEEKLATVIGEAGR
jgi:cell division protein ZapA (FtsZ GTPase activity inhibitor)